MATVFIQQVWAKSTLQGRVKAGREEEDGQRKWFVDNVTEEIGLVFGKFRKVVVNRAN